MGHQHPGHMPPPAERVGCAEHPDGYDPACFGCWLRNGGGDD